MGLCGLHGYCSLDGYVICVNTVRWDNQEKQLSFRERHFSSSKIVLWWRKLDKQYDVGYKTKKRNSRLWVYSCRPETKQTLQRTGNVDAKVSVDFKSPSMSTNEQPLTLKHQVLFLSHRFPFMLLHCYPRHTVQVRLDNKHWARINHGVVLRFTGLQTSLVVLSCCVVYRKQILLTNPKSFFFSIHTFSIELRRVNMKGMSLDISSKSTWKISLFSLKCSKISNMELEKDGKNLLLHWSLKSWILFYL